MKHPASLTLFDYWQSLRRGRQVPERNDLDPVAIRGVLSFTFMLEVDGKPPAARDYPVRVSGTRLDALFRRSLKGTSFATLWQPRHRAILQSVAEAVLDEGRPAIVGGTAAPDGCAPVPVEMLMLPLRCHGQTHARMFCSLAPFTSPDWLGLHGVAPLDLTSWRLIETGAEATRERTRNVQPLAARAAMRPPLRVIAGGRSPDGAGTPCDLQSRIKAVVPGSGNALLSTRSQ